MVVRYFFITCLVRNVGGVKYSGICQLLSPPASPSVCTHEHMQYKKQTHTHRHTDTQTLSPQTDTQTHAHTCTPRKHNRHTPRHPQLHRYTHTQSDPRTRCMRTIVIYPSCWARRQTHKQSDRYLSQYVTVHLCLRGGMLVRQWRMHLYRACIHTHPDTHTNRPTLTHKHSPTETHTHTNTHLHRHIHDKISWITVAPNKHWWKILCIVPLEDKFSSKMLFIEVKYHPWLVRFSISWMAISSISSSQILERLRGFISILKKEPVLPLLIAIQEVKFICNSGTRLSVENDLS